MFRALIVLAIAITVSPCGLAAVVFDEEGSGTDLSSDVAAPTVLAPLIIGDNDVLGIINNVIQSPDIDTFSFVVPVGLQIDAITLNSFEGNNHFFGLDEGPVVVQNSNALLLALLVGSGNAGDNLFDLPQSFVGASGVSAPLPSGQYAIHIQENTLDDVFPYSLSITTSAVSVPEPSCYFAVAAFAVGYVSYRRKRKS